MMGFITDEFFAANRGQIITREPTMLLAFVSIVFIVSFSFIADHPKLRIFFGLSLFQWNFHCITPLQAFVLYIHRGTNY